MAKLLKLRRGTTSQHSSFTGAEGEVTVDTDKESLVVHNGSTAGGFPLLRQDLSNLPTGTIDNADVSSSAAIAGSKISPTFTSNVTISNSDPSIIFVDGNANPDFQIRGNGGALKFIDNTNNNADRMAINSDGHVDVYGNLDVGAGLDVTGTINATSDIATSGNITANNGTVTVSGTAPKITFTETNDNPDYKLEANGGSIAIIDTTNSATRFAIGTSTTNIYNNLDVSSGVDVTGNITCTGQYNTTSTADEKIVLGGSSNPYIRWREGSTDKAYIQWNQNGNLYIVNQESGEQLVVGSGSTGLVWVDGGSSRTVWHSGNDGGGSGLDADTLDGIQGSAYATKAGGFNFTGNIGVASSYPRIYLTDTDNNNDYSLINNNGNFLIYDDTNNGYRMRIDGSTGTANMHWNPSSNNTYDLGTSSYRWRNIYTNDLNLSNEGSSNDVDGSWGDWTIQEGESDLFLKNNRSGKKYKFNLTEVS